MHYTNPGDDVMRFHTQLTESFCQTNVGVILDTSELLELHREAFGQYYLHDFVRIAHKCKHKKRDMEDLEYEVQTCVWYRTNDYYSFYTAHCEFSQSCDFH